MPPPESRPIAEHSAADTDPTFFRRLVEEGLEIALVVSAHGEILYAPACTRDQIGLSPHPSTGVSIYDIVHPDDRSSLRLRLERVVSIAPRRLPVNFRIVRADGGARVLDLSARDLRADPEVAGIALHGRDITDEFVIREALEADRQRDLRTQKLDSVARLSGGVAHDFNNMLTVVRGNAELALSELPSDSSAREDLEEVLSASDQAAGLTRQLLAFSRTQLLRPRRVDLNELLRRLTPDLEQIWGEKVVARLQLADDLPEVCVDVEQIGLVITALAQNAVDAMPDGGALTIETATDPEACVNVVITDTGEGIPDSIRHRIFDPFFSTRGHGRRGLGLSSAYGIVRQSDGDLTFDSSPPHGSRFVIRLPRAFARGERVQRPVQGDRADPGSTILVVEDERAVRALACRVLESRGYMVMEATDADSALLLLEEEHGEVDLLLTDVFMPRMDGRTLRRQLQERYPELRVLYMSGHSADSDVAARLADGGVPVLSKPFTVRELVTAVQNALRRSPAP